MNDKIIERQANKALAEINNVIFNLQEYSEKLEEIINNFDKEMEEMSDRIIELEESIIDLKKEKSC